MADYYKYFLHNCTIGNIENVKIYVDVCTHEDIFVEGLARACKNHHYAIVKLLLGICAQFNPEHHDTTMAMAICQSGNMDAIIPFFKDKKRRTDANIIYGYSKVGYSANFDIMCLLLRLSDSRIAEDLMFVDADYGREIVKLMLELGDNHVTNYDYAFGIACRYFDLDAIKCLCRPDMNPMCKRTAISWGCARGDLEILQFLVDYIDYDLNYYIASVCEGGSMECLNYLITHPNFANVFIGGDLTLLYACIGGNADMINFIISMGITDYLLAIEGACISGRFALAQTMWERHTTGVIFDNHEVTHILTSLLCKSDVSFTETVNFLMERELIPKDYQLDNRVLQEVAKTFNIECLGLAVTYGWYDIALISPEYMGALLDYNPEFIKYAAVHPTISELQDIRNQQIDILYEDIQFPRVIASIIAEYRGIF